MHAEVSRYADEENDVITIDILNDDHAAAEKPASLRRLPGLPGEDLRYDPGYAWVQARKDAMLEAAHTARLLKSRQAGGPANDVQRFVAEMKAEVLTLAERYVSRARQPGAASAREAGG